MWESCILWTLDISNGNFKRNCDSYKWKIIIWKDTPLKEKKDSQGCNLKVLGFIGVCTY